MAFRNLLTSASVALTALVLIACDGNQRPTSPSPPASQSPVAPVPPEFPPISGEITLTSATPASGATIDVFDCDPNLPLHSARPAHVIGICSDQLRMTFDVVVDRDVPEAYVAVDFLNTRGQCGFAWSASTSLVAGQRHTATVLGIVLSDDPNVHAPCALPATTTSLIASVRSRGPGARVQVAREFTQTYTFVPR